MADKNRTLFELWSDLIERTGFSSENLARVLSTDAPLVEVIPHQPDCRWPDSYCPCPQADPTKDLRALLVTLRGEAWWTQPTTEAEKAQAEERARAPRAPGVPASRSPGTPAPRAAQGHENRVLDCGHTAREHRDGLVYTSGLVGQGPTKPVEYKPRCLQADEDLAKRELHKMVKGDEAPTPVQQSHLEDLEALKQLMLKRDLGFNDILILLQELQANETCSCDPKGYCDENCVPCRGEEYCQA